MPQTVIKPFDKLPIPMQPVCHARSSSQQAVLYTVGSLGDERYLNNTAETIAPLETYRNESRCQCRHREADRDHCHAAQNLRKQIAIIVRFSYAATGGGNRLQCQCYHSVSWQRQIAIAADSRIRLPRQQKQIVILPFFAFYYMRYSSSQRGNAKHDCHFSAEESVLKN